MNSWLHKIDLDIRESDIDILGIVNNHIYQAYFNHGSNRMLHMLGYDVKKLHEEGCDCIFTKVEIEYKAPLILGDRICICSNLEFLRTYKVLFIQEIVRSRDNVLCAKAIFTSCLIGTSGPIEPIPLREAKQKYLSEQNLKT